MIGFLAITTAIVIQLSILISCSKCSKHFENAFRIIEQDLVNEHIVENNDEEHVVTQNRDVIKEMPKNIKSQISEQVCHDETQTPIKPPRKKKCEKRTKITMYISKNNKNCETSCDNDRSTTRDLSGNEIVSYSGSKQLQNISERIVPPKLLVTDLSQSRKSQCQSNDSCDKTEGTSYMVLTPWINRKTIHANSTSVFTSTKVNTKCDKKRLSVNIRKTLRCIDSFSQIIRQLSIQVFKN